jgi:hypothetical protein
MERATLPVAVELCVRDKDGFPCLGLIHRLEPNGRIYCTRCGGTQPGVIYVQSPDGKEVTRTS